MDAAIAALEKAFALLEEETAGDTIACSPGCCECCTDRVTLSTLEGRKILDYLEKTGQTGLLARLVPVLPERYRPLVTVNGYARICMEGREAPLEPEGETGVCPFLTGGRCPVYPVRPLACRVLVSKARCMAGGAAEMPSCWLTRNMLYTQWVEHLDRQGLFGNLADVLLALSGHLAARAVLVKNRPAPCFSAPPEHREQALRLLARLQKTLA